MRIPIAPVALLVLAAGCSDLPTQLNSIEATPILLSPSNPPPPPVNGDPADPPTCIPDSGCSPLPAQVPVGARYFRSPGGAFAWVSFFATTATTRISSNARVHDGGRTLIGQGTIETEISTGRIVVDLSTVQGSLLQSPRPGTREFTFTAQARYLYTGLQVSGGVLFWYGY